MSDLEERLLTRWSASGFLIAGVVIAGLGYLPLQLYIVFGPRDGNPIGLGLLAIVAVPAGLLVFCHRPNQTRRRLFSEPKGLTMFKALGIAVGLYALYAAIVGRVYIKSGPGGRWVMRHESPEYFWISVVVYFALAIALVAVF